MGCLNDVSAIEVGQAEVGQDVIECRFLLHGEDGRGAVVYSRDLIAQDTQQPGQSLTADFVIVDDEDPGSSRVRAGEVGWFGVRHRQRSSDDRAIHGRLEEGDQSTDDSLASASISA